MLKLIFDAPWFSRNDRSREDLGVLTVVQFPAAHLAKDTLKRVSNSANPVIAHLRELDPDRPPPRTAVRRVMAKEYED